MNFVGRPKSVCRVGRMQDRLQLRSSSRQSPLLLSWSAPAAGIALAIALEGEIGDSMNEAYRRLNLR
jgi:hypothetical protein